MNRSPWRRNVVVDTRAYDAGIQGQISGVTHMRKMGMLRTSTDRVRQDGARTERPGSAGALLGHWASSGTPI